MKLFLNILLSLLFWPALAAAQTIGGGTYPTPVIAPTVRVRPLGVYSGSWTSEIPVYMEGHWDTTYGPLVDSDIFPHPVTGGTGGGGGGGGGGAVTVADGADITLGTKTDTAYSGSGSASAIAILKGLYATQPVINADAGQQVHVMNFPSSTSVSNFPTSTGVNNFPSTQAVTKADGSDDTLGSKADTAAGTGTVSLIALMKALYAIQPTLNGDNGALAHITNFPTTQSVSLATAPAIPNTDFGPEGSKRSYRYSVLFTPATSLGAFFQIEGGSTCTVRIRSVTIRALAAATAAVSGFTVTKNSTAISGGTSTAPTGTKLDSSNATSCATLALYSAVGTVGTLIGQIDAQPYYVGVGANAQQPVTFPFGQDGTQSGVLRGTAEYYEVANATTAFSANTSLSMTIEWTEE